MTSLHLSGGDSSHGIASTCASAGGDRPRGRNRPATAAIVCVGLFFVALTADVITHPNIPDWLLVATAAMPVGAMILGIVSRRKPRAAGRRRAHAAVTGGVIITVLILGILILLPSLCRPREAVYVAKCGSNLKTICAGLYHYADAHNGEYPPSLDALVADGMTPAVLVCPASNDSPAVGGTADEQIKNLHEENFHQSYVYIRPTPDMIASDAVVVYEHPHNHRHTRLNALFLNGEVRLLDKEEALKLIPGIEKQLVEGAYDRY